jgi:endonuclease/exonuclease/phosphatase family metal-dependent hydrolase
LDTAINEIIKLNPDIVCLQEIISKGQINIVKNKLTSSGYHIFNEEGFVFNKGGLVFASKFPILNKEFIEFKNQGKLLSLQLSDRIINKGYQKVEIEIDSQKIQFYNVHIVSRYNGSSLKEKVEQIHQLDQLGEDLEADRDRNKVCIGDFNTQSSGDYYMRFINKTFLIDPLARDCITYSPENTNSKQKFSFDHNSRIDYILFSPSIKQIETSIIFKNEFIIENRKQHLSDHFGIQSVFEIV